MENIELEKKICEEKFSQMRAKLVDIGGTERPVQNDCKFHTALMKIYNRSDSGLFYGQDEKHFESAISDIEKIIKDARK